MAIIPVGYAQLNMFFSGEAVPTGAQCVFGVNNSIDNSAASIGNTFNDAMGESSLMAELTDFITYDGCLVKLGPTATGASAIATASIVGEVESQAVAPNTSVLVRKATLSGGRAGRGRMFLPGVSEGDVTASGELNGGRRASIAGALEVLRQYMITNDQPLVVLHGEGSPLVIPSQIESMDVDATVATQRRRLRR